MRGLLGNAYFAGGRFASAEAAYADALSLSPAQPQVALKRALVQIAQGKNGEALSSLEAARSFIEAADYGLAVALAGQPAEAISVLEPAARAQDANSRVRQNLALAYALSGDWTAARTIAAQDLAPDQVDARVQQWMALAKPARASDQVAALIGVTPAAADPGQPIRIALNKDPQIRRCRGRRRTSAASSGCPSCSGSRFCRTHCSTSTTAGCRSPSGSCASRAASSKPGPGHRRCRCDFPGSARGFRGDVREFRSGTEGSRGSKEASANPPRRCPESQRQFEGRCAAGRVQLGRPRVGCLGASHQEVPSARELFAYARALRRSEGHRVASLDPGLRQSA